MDCNVTDFGQLMPVHFYDNQADVFNKFKDENGSFKECLIVDVPGMLSLYEAGHLGVRGEEILDEALAFTTTHLDSTAKAHVSYEHAEQISQALERPLQKDLERACAKRYCRQRNFGEINSIGPENN